MQRFNLHIASVATAWMLAASVVAGAGPAGAQDTPPSFAGTVKDLLPAVVNISTTQTAAAVSPSEGLPGPMQEFFREFFGDRGPPGMSREISALGSGFLIDPAGYVVTNSHVIAEADEVRVSLADERSFVAEVVGDDPATDLALLKIDTSEPLPHVQWGQSEETEIGDWVVAIGNPFGLGGSVTVGVLSGRARDIRAGPYDDFLQTDAPINRGNSGGPLFDVNGRVIGVNTVILSPGGGNIGIGFAIPASTAQPVIEQLRDTGTVQRGWLGVQVQGVNEAIARAIGREDTSGALVAEVLPASPAAEAGLRPGDVIDSYAGQKIQQTRDLPRLVANTPIGETVPIGVWREGDTLMVQTTISSRTDETVAARREQPEADQGMPPQLGMTVAPLTDDVRAQLGTGRGVEGVVVTDVDPQGTAAEAGVTPGDVVVAVDGAPVTSPQSLAQAIDSARSGRGEQASVLLRLNRDGEYRYVGLPLQRG